MRQATTDRAATPALAATLGCLERSLKQLAHGVEGLEALAALAGGRSGTAQEAALEAVEFLVQAQEELLRCAASIDAARARVGPLLAS